MQNHFEVLPVYANLAKAIAVLFIVNYSVFLCNLCCWCF